MAEFKAGDVVALKSGGPPMTVEEVEGSSVFCVWFEGKKSERGRFTEAALERYQPQAFAPRRFERS
ncbi:MAG: DUF2158 domain-containing protein [Deltaproteobacteria bacterium]|nr:DUF2158 domain-containing protein [Deltaproteobacteria bacterium]